MVTSSALQKRAALLTTTSSTGWSSGEVLMIFETSAAALCCSRASSRSRVSRATSVSCPATEALRAPADSGALRRFDVTALGRRDLAGLPPALERRLIAFPKAQDKAL